MSFIHERARRNALNIDVRRVDFCVPQLPEQFEGFTILHLSDLHVDMTDAFPAVLAERVTDLDYNICILTGDFRYRTHGPIDAVLRGMEHLPHNLRGPVYGVLGNHDSIRMVPQLEAMGIRMIMNESAVIQRDGADIYLAGIDDPHYFRAENFDRACAGVPQESFAMLLAHSPEVYHRAAHLGFDIMFSGRAIALKLPAIKNLDQVIVNPPSSQAFSLQPTFE